MFRNPFSFKGRIGRTEYALSSIFGTIALFVAFALMSSFYDWGLNAFPLLLPIYWFLYSQGAKRCQDMGNNGFYQLIPFYGFVMFFGDGQRRSNKYGPDPKLIALQPPTTQTPLPSKQFLRSDKSLETIGSELLSSSLLLTFLVLLTQLVFARWGWLEYFLQTLQLMGGYFLLLYVGNGGRALPELPWYFILHRFGFALAWALFTGIYGVLFLNQGTEPLLAFGTFILNIISGFIYTYVPFLLYKNVLIPTNADV